jgi:excisionase family DNA binding protein
MEAAMSLEHNPQRQKRGPRKRRAIPPVCVSPEEFTRVTGISRPTAYRMMADGRLRYTQLSSRMRKIPATEFERLGLSGTT